MFLIFDTIAVIVIIAGTIAQNAALIFAGVFLGIATAIPTIIAICKIAREYALIKKIDYLVDYDDGGKELQKYLFKYYNLKTWKILLYFNIGDEE